MLICRFTDVDFLQVSRRSHFLAHSCFHTLVLFYRWHEISLCWLVHCWVVACILSTHLGSRSRKGVLLLESVCILIRELRLIDRSLENVILKDPNFVGTVWKEHFSISMLDALSPLTLVDTPVSPVHLSVPMSLVIQIVSFVDVATSPPKLTIAMLVVHKVLSFIAVRLDIWPALLPNSFAMFHTIFKRTCVHTSILPFVATITFWFPLLVLPYVNISICEDVSSLAVLQTVLPLSLVSITILPCVNPVPVSFRVQPLSYVRVSIYPFPDSVSFLHPVLPLSIKYLAWVPVINSLAMSFALVELPFIPVSIWVPFKPATSSLIVDPFPLVDSSILIDHDSFAISHAVYKKSSVDRIMRFLDNTDEILLFLQLLIVKLIRLHGVLLFHVNFFFLHVLCESWIDTGFIISSTLH